MLGLQHIEMHHWYEWLKWGIGVFGTLVIAVAGILAIRRKRAK